MKTIFYAMNCLFLIGATTAYAGAIGINILSEEYHVDGGVYVPLYDWLPPEYEGAMPEAVPNGSYIDNKYNFTGSVPQSGNASAPYIRDLVYGGEEQIIQANSSASFLRVEAATLDGYWNEPFPHAFALATYRMVFQPYTNYLQISLSPSGEACWYHGELTEGFGYRLIDLTQNLVLAAVDAQDVQNWRGYNQTDYASNNLNTSNQYELFLWGRTVVWGDDNGSYAVSLEATIIPEPATVLLLGLGAVILRKKPFNS